MKENKDKNTTYSGDSIASKWLSGTWLGNLLGYGNNSYADGYGTTRNYPDLKESAQGQQLDRMADTAKGAGKLILTGAAFMNPVTAGSTAASLLGTGAQAYFITDGLRDAYTRFMNPNKTAGDAVWTGLDLIGATPAIRSFGNGIRNFKTRSLFPDMEVRESLEVNPKYKVTGGVSASKIDKDVQSGKDEAISFLKSDVRKEANEHNKALANRIGYDKFVIYKGSPARASVPMIKPVNPSKSGGHWVDTQDGGGYFITGAMNNGKMSGNVHVSSSNPAGDQMYISVYSPNIKNTSMHEHLHRGSYGEKPALPATSETVIPFLQTQNFYDWKTKKLLDPNAGPYLRNRGEAAVNAVDIGNRAGLVFGQPYPGKKAAISFFTGLENLAPVISKYQLVHNYNWRQHPKRVWDAFTGRYYTLPIVGAGLGLATTPNNSQNDDRRSE